jgi:hypothetical protein
MSNDDAHPRWSPSQPYLRNMACPSDMNPLTLTYFSRPYISKLKKWPCVIINSVGFSWSKMAYCVAHTKKIDNSLRAKEDMSVFYQSSP